MTAEDPVPADDLLGIALQAAEEAADLILEAARAPRVVGYKGATDLVTDTDRHSEAVIKNRISAAFPEHDILAEESGHRRQRSDYLWVIDPLDGTTNFVHGYPAFAVSIAVVHRQKPLCGVVVELPVRKVYSACRGRGAFCDGQKIRVSATRDLRRALLVTGFAYDHDEAWQANMELFKILTDRTQGVRRLGAAAVDLVHVACGKVDAFWEFRLNPWDVAAGLLIVREAGGRVTRLDGGHLDIYDQQLLASNGSLHARMLEYTKPVVRGLLKSGITLRHPSAPSSQPA